MKKEDKEIIIGLRLIEEINSEYQNIRLYKFDDGRIVLTLDTFVQFASGQDLDAYHSAITEIIDKNTNNILVLGGGDGLVAKYIFNKNPKAKITLVELDKVMIDLFSKRKELVDLNSNALSKCNVIIGDAKEYVKESKEKYDAIILDLPDGNNEELKKLYEEEFYKDTIRCLKDEGKIAIQTHLDITDKVVNIVEKYLSKVEKIEYSMIFMGEGIIVTGKK